MSIGTGVVVAVTAIDKRLDDAERPSLPPLKIEEPDKPVAKLPPKAREYSTQTLIDNTLSKTHSPKLAAAVYERVSRNLSERADSANWSEIANAIVAVMKTKTGMKLDEDQLVTKVLDRVTKSSRKKTMESVVGEAPAINLSTPSNQAG